MPSLKTDFDELIRRVEAGRDHPILASLCRYGIRSCRATALPLEDCRKASKGIRDEQTLCSDRL